MNQPPVTAVILAGGRSRRMGGEDKAWINYQSKPMIQHVIAKLQNQTSEIKINTNRDIEKYKQLGLAVFTDNNSDFNGPLAGVDAATFHCQTRYLFITPCDVPRLPEDIIERLTNELVKNKTAIAIPNDGKRNQHLCMLLDLQAEFVISVSAFINSNSHKVNDWVMQNNHCVVDFSDQSDAFQNINTPEELSQ